MALTGKELDTGSIVANRRGVHTWGLRIPHSLGGPR
jgi:hypothetical protein